MFGPQIPFTIAEQFIPGLEAGNIIRYGAILKDASTGKIVAHVQETGLVQKIFGAASSFDPTGATGLIGVAQNAYVSNQLGVIQSTLNTMQVLQVANLFSSVIGIGVTAASAAVLAQRLKAVENTLGSIEKRIDELPAEWRALGLRSRLVDVSTSLERLREAEFRSNPEELVRQADKELHQGFNQIHGGLCQVVVEAKVDPELLRVLLAGLALCASSEFKALIWLNEKEAAQHRSKLQCSKLTQLAFLMPRDEMGSRLPGSFSEARSISSDCSEIRLRVASQPELARHLDRLDIHGRDYVERSQNEENEPFLFLPNESN